MDYRLLDCRWREADFPLLAWSRWASALLAGLCSAIILAIKHAIVDIEHINHHAVKTFKKILVLNRCFVD